MSTEDPPAPWSLVAMIAAAPCSPRPACVYINRETESIQPLGAVRARADKARDRHDRKCLEGPSCARSWRSKSCTRRRAAPRNPCTNSGAAVRSAGCPWARAGRSDALASTAPGTPGLRGRAAGAPR
eukprot:scaffold46781_cov258-Isochrysis_galbana.AAC.4